jgi:subtilase family serine protease
MPTAIVVPLESSQVQQSIEVLNVPYAVLDIQGNDTGRHLRSSTASISKEGKKVDVADMRLQPSGLQYNLSLPTIG